MKTLWMAGALVFAVSCTSGRQATRSRIFETGIRPLAARSIQSRVFDTPDQTRVLRAVMATLQDLEFLLDDVDEELGTISATKLAAYELRLTVTVRARGERQTVVRANGQFRRKPLYEPEPYQQFFAALENAMFLAAQQVD